MNFRISKDEYEHGYLLGLYNHSYWGITDAATMGYWDGHGDREMYYGHRKFKPGEQLNGSWEDINKYIFEGEWIIQTEGYGYGYGRNYYYFDPMGFILSNGKSFMRSKYFEHDWQPFKSRDQSTFTIAYHE